MIKLKHSHIKSVTEAELVKLMPLLASANQKLKTKTGPGAEFTGWLDQPIDYDKEEFARIEKAAEKIRQICDALIVIGIGGSYLGARAVLEFLHSPYYNQRTKDAPQIYFAGNSFSGRELTDILDLCKDKRVCVNVISKSGTTTESAIAFRIIKTELEKRYSKQELKERIFVTTDARKGRLKELSDKEGYEQFVIPDDIGGRFSVLTAVGLLPIAVSGADIRGLMEGAALCRESLFAKGPENPAYTYALLRNAFYNKGRKVEVLASYDPSFRYMGEWFKQLFGESEGKDKKGIFPASVIFSSDLHSLGQYIQDGTPMLFETLCRQSAPDSEMTVPMLDEDYDGLNYIAGQTLDSVNEKACLGTLLAHADGGTETIIIEYENKDEKSLGALIYFFFLACGISGYMLGVNPFDQPGVEEYKKNMFALLGKNPGSEESERLNTRIQELL